MAKIMSVLNLSLLVYFKLTTSRRINPAQFQSVNSVTSQNNMIQCPENEDCMIQCSSSQSCKAAIIQCPLNGNCLIECKDIESCADIVINATHSESGITTILCEDSFTCRGMNVYGSKLDTKPNGDHFNLFCSGEYQSCGEAKVYCPLTGDCSIECNGADSACKNISISGPINGDLVIGCNGKRSCLQSRFDARYSFEFELTGCIETDSCLDLVIYCPENTNSTPNCLIQGNDNLGRYTNDKGLQIYAVNGWKDVHVEYSGSYGNHHGGTMYCGYAYDDYCQLAVDEWKCGNETAFCNLIGTLTENNMSTTDNLDLLSSDDSNYGDDYAEDEEVPIIDHKFEHGAMGMLLIGGGLIALAVGCVICGSIRKGYYVAKRKLSDMGFKSPFQRASNYHQTASSQHVGQMMDDIEQSMDASYSHHHHQQTIHSQSYPALHGHTYSHENNEVSRPQQTRSHPTLPLYNNNNNNHSQSHTAHIHKNHSHSGGGHTATINRPISYSRGHSGHNILNQHGKTPNVNRGHRAVSNHERRPGHNGHGGHGGHHAANPHRAVSHGHHGQANGHHPGHPRHARKHQAEMVHIR